MTDINTLMETDPRLLNDEQRDEIIAELRKRRQTYKLSTEPAAKAAKKAPAKKVANISLDELGL